MKKRSLLQSITFGQRVAEDETDVLSTYFVETDQWIRLHRGDIDIVYGPKGSGKSALYSLLISNTENYFDKNTLIATAENPRGATAFQDLVISPPAGEREFTNLWKLYFVTLLQGKFEEFDISNTHAKKLKSILEQEGLIKGSLTLAGIFRAVSNYVKKIINPQAVEGTVTYDPITQQPTATGKIIFSEPSAEEINNNYSSVDILLSLANEALKKEEFAVWILLDRLDVAFAEAVELEKNALRALFRVYLDLQAYSNIRLKIFLRTDIWKSITDEGFREASHITRHVTITWNRSSLLNLIVRRAVHNEELLSFYSVKKDIAKQSIEKQEEFFYRICPNQVDVGPNKPKTVDWLLSRTTDGTKQNAPRELIHFLNVLREVQVKRFEIGEAETDDEQLFIRPAFKDALPEVSRVRLEQTLYPEYPTLKDLIEKMKGARTSQTKETLAVIWAVTPEEATNKANTLATVGFFEVRGTQQAPEYWVPFLYRDALDLVQGAAE